MEGLVGYARRNWMVPIPEMERSAFMILMMTLMPTCGKGVKLKALKDFVVWK